jgi:hypothetical protein
MLSFLFCGQLLYTKDDSYTGDENGGSLTYAKADVANGFSTRAFSKFSQDFGLGNLLEFVALLAFNFLSMFMMNMLST